MRSITPQSQEHLRDMLADLNEMLARHRRGEDPRFDEFMDRHGDFFPDNPADIDELLDGLARRAAAMQAMLNSMTPEQLDELSRLSEALLDDAGLRQQVGELGEQLRALMPGGWDAGRRHARRRGLGLGGALDDDGRARRPRPPGGAPARRDLCRRSRPRSTPSASATCSATTPCAPCSDWRN